jgi:hypothetical protein
MDCELIHNPFFPLTLPGGSMSKTVAVVADYQIGQKRTTDILSQTELHFQDES